METKEKEFKKQKGSEGKSENTKQGSQGSTSKGGTSQGSTTPDNLPEKDAIKNKSNQDFDSEDGKSYSREDGSSQGIDWDKSTQKGGDGTKRYTKPSNNIPKKGGNVDFDDEPAEQE
jgi:hypothetical protein